MLVGARHRDDPGPSRRHRLRAGALAGLALVALAAGCSRSGDDTAATSTTTTAAPPETTSTTEVPMEAGRQVFAYVPDVGDCYDLRRTESSGGGGPAGTEVVLRLDCEKPHTNEVFAVVTVDLKDYPGEVWLKNLAKLECPKSFEAYVGVPYETSALDLGYRLPSQSSWNQGYRKTIGCLVTSGTGPKLEGSVKGTKR